MSLTREQILKTKDKIKVEPIKVPEWKGTVYVRVMSGFSRDQWEQSMLDKTDEATGKNDIRGVKAQLCVLTLCDEKGNLLFKPDDMAEVNQLSAAALEEIASKAAVLNKLREVDVKEAEKN